VLAGLVVGGLPTSLGAQEREPIGATPPASVSSPPAKFATRMATGYVGELVGILGLGIVGYHIERNTWSCNCDDPGFQGLALGMFAGAILGAGIGASLPEFSDDKCSFG